MTTPRTSSPTHEIKLDCTTASSERHRFSLSVHLTPALDAYLQSSTAKTAKTNRHDRGSLIPGACGFAEHAMTILGLLILPLLFPLKWKGWWLRRGDAESCVTCRYGVARLPVCTVALGNLERERGRDKAGQTAWRSPPSLAARAKVGKLAWLAEWR